MYAPQTTFASAARRGPTLAWSGNETPVLRARSRRDDMKTSLLAMATIVALATGVSAYAEGNGPDFPGLFQPRGVLANPTTVQSGSESYPVAVGTTLNPVVAGNVLPANGSEGIVQSANSLPAGFANGTPASEYAQSVERYWASRQAIGSVRTIARAGR